MDGLSGPILGFFFLFVVFYLINRGGQQNISKNTSIYHDFWSKVFSLLALVNPKCPPWKRFFAVVYGLTSLRGALALNVGETSVELDEVCVHLRNGCSFWQRRLS